MKNIKKHGHCLFVALAVLASVNHLVAQGTAFMYQGSLNANGVPANGFFEFEFSLYTNAARVGTQVGSTLTNLNVGVTNGLFTTSLDFGDVFTGNDTWLAIAVRTNGGSSFTALNPLQELTPTPYAIYAPNSGTAGSANTVAATNITGTLALAQLPGAVVTTSDTNVTFVNLTLSGDLTLPSPATIDSGGSSLLYFDSLFNFYAGPGAGNLSNSDAGNTGIGYGSLLNNSNGANNTALGYQALVSNTNGSDNTATGERALQENLSGSDNTGLGRHALENNINGNQNTAVGSSALSGLKGGSNNIALGYLAGNSYGLSESSNILIGSLGVGRENNTIHIGDGQTETFIAGTLNGDGGGLTNISASQLSGTISLARLPTGVVTNHETNVAFVNLTLSSNLNLPSPATIEAGGSSLLLFDGNDNFYAGPGAGSLSNAGTGNTGIGGASLQINTNGTENTAIGYQSLNKNTNGSYNTASGERALAENTSGNDNAAHGRHALENNLIGNDNTATGYQTLVNLTNGSYNTAIGSSALSGLKGGSNNIALGYLAGNSYGLSERNNILIGSTGVGAENNTIHIGGSQTETYIAGVLNGDGGGLTNLNASQFTSSVVTNGEPSVTLGNLTLDGSLTLPEPIVINYSTGLFPPSYLSFLYFGANNLYLGPNAGNGNHGAYNTGMGEFALQQVSTGEYNTAIGKSALQLNTTGANNTGSGIQALYANTNGSQNTAYGAYALYNSPGGTDNIALGYLAGSTYVGNESSNIDIGNPGVAGDNDVIRIGDNQTETYLAGTINCGTIFSGTIFGTGMLLSDGILAGGNITSGGDITADGTITANGSLTTYGLMTCCTLTVTGGCDLAEPFPISTAEQQVSEGAVMVIDEKNPGQLKLTDRPYDTRVAGVVSGANGINPGIQMHQQGVVEGGKNVALSGRVYVQADASNGAIEPGDLLTTSSTPGRAMKVTDHIRAQGAILGKAMSALSEGNGMVLVLVTLQ
jgi:hypothetical protein